MRRTEPVRRPGAAGDRPARLWLRALAEVAVITVVVVLYRLARLITADDATVATANAVSVLDLEALLPVPRELWLQQLALHSEHLVRAANAYYAVVHFPATVACLVWMFLRRRDDYGWLRTSLIGLTAGALVVHLALPLAPPRMMPGFVDTGLEYGPSVYRSAGGAVNQIAAMPSLHVGWAFAVALAVLATTRSRWRWLVVLHPVVTVAVVVLTANHYWVDGLVAVVLLVAVLRVAAPGPVHRLPWLALDRDAAAPPPGRAAARWRNGSGRPWRAPDSAGLGQQGREAPDAGRQVVVAEGVGEPEVAGGAEGLAGDDRDADLLEHQLGELRRRGDLLAPQGPTEQALHRRVAVEGAGRLRAAHAVDRVEHRGHGAAAPVEGGPHRVHGLEVPGDGGQRGRLGDVVHVRAQVRLQVRGGGDRRRPGRPSSPPASRSWRRSWRRR